MKPEDVSGFQSVKGHGMGIQTINDTEVHELAYQAIRGPKPFRRFKDFIQTYPDLQDLWHTWKDHRSRNRALEWLEEEGLGLSNED